MKHLKSAAIISLLFVPLNLVFATGIQVSPSNLDFVVSQGQTVTQTITAVNPTADVQIFEVYADDFAENIKAMPASFTLESGGSKKVAITFDSAIFKDLSDQKLSTNLSVVAKPLADSKLSVGAGVKIPVTISVGKTEERAVNNKPKIIILILVGLFGLLAFYNHKKKPAHK